MSEAITGARAALASKPRRRASLVALIVVCGLMLAGILGAALWVRALGPLPDFAREENSFAVTDRNGKLLRAYPMQDGRWRLPVVAARDVDPRYLDMLLAYEDAHFRSHHGVDPRALLRAAWQLASERRIVSGGSTITMQLARLVEPRRTRSIEAKLKQIMRALQLERSLSKDAILDQYLTRAPFGGNLEGIRAASLAYFGKEPKRLNLAEAALLVALPQSPEARRPDRAPDAARAARGRVLDRMVEEGIVSAEDAARASDAAIPEQRRMMPMQAPHAADRALLAAKETKTDDAQARPQSAQLAIDAPIQIGMEKLIRERALALGPGVSAALMVVDRASGDVVARVGAPDFFDEARAGQVDMTRAVRSPGSTLKPFIYGMAFEDGIAHPNTLIDDRPSRFGAYTPENFDMAFQGTVSVRQALQLSLNVPAILLLERVGAPRLSARLMQAGGALKLPPNEAPGLAMGLGGVGISLHDLVGLYTGLARLGDAIALRDVIASGEEPAARNHRRLLDPVAAWHVGDVLRGAPPPDNGVPHKIAFKTGTSYGYRDAWAVGFDGRYVIGVWTGRPDGAPVPGLIGRKSAAPILFDAFARTGQVLTPLPKAPRGTLSAPNAKLPLPLQRFRPAGEEMGRAHQALRIQFPLNGSRLDLGSGDGSASLSTIALKVSGGVLPLTIMLNGRMVTTLNDARQAQIAPEGPGFTRLTVMDASGAADTIVVRLQ